MQRMVMALLVKKGMRNKVGCAAGYCDSRRVLAMVTMQSCLWRKMGVGWLCCRDRFWFCKEMAGKGRERERE